jgi:hypothetical protein
MTLQRPVTLLVYLATETTEFTCIRHERPQSTF